MKERAQQLLKHKKGQAAVEYVLVAAGLMGMFLSFYVLYSHLVPQQFDQGARIILSDYSTQS